MYSVTSPSVEPSPTVTVTVEANFTVQTVTIQANFTVQTVTIHRALSQCRVGLNAIYAERATKKYPGSVA